MGYYIEMIEDICPVCNRYDVVAKTSITYNYSIFYKETIDKEKGIRWIYGKTGKECEQKLRDAINILGTEKHPDVWKPTPGNAGMVLKKLMEWCIEHPDAVFRGD